MNEYIIQTDGGQAISIVESCFEWLLSDSVDDSVYLLHHWREKGERKLEYFWSLFPVEEQTQKYSDFGTNQKTYLFLIRKNFGENCDFDCQWWLDNFQRFCIPECEFIHRRGACQYDLGKLTFRKQYKSNDKRLVTWIV